MTCAFSKRYRLFGLTCNWGGARNARANPSSLTEESMAFGNALRWPAYVKRAWREYRGGPSKEQ